MATFMPKPFSHLTGSAIPHEPLGRRAEPVRGDPSDDPRGLGLSELATSSSPG